MERHCPLRYEQFFLYFNEASYVYFCQLTSKSLTKQQQNAPPEKDISRSTKDTSQTCSGPDPEKTHAVT